jgi:hypothetical protein
VAERGGGGGDAADGGHELVERGDVDALDVLGGLGALPVAPSDGDGAARVNEPGRGGLVAGLESGQAGGDELGFVAGRNEGLAGLAVGGTAVQRRAGFRGGQRARASSSSASAAVNRVRVAARAASMRAASPAARSAAATASRSSGLSSDVQAGATLRFVMVVLLR